MDIGDVFKPFGDLVGVLTRLGEALSFQRVVLPAVVFSTASLLSFGAGFSSLLSNALGLTGLDGSFPANTGRMHLFFGLVFIAAVIAFYLMNKFLTGVLLKYILVWLRPGAITDRETLEKILNFIRDPEKYVKSHVKSRGLEIAATKEKLELDVSNSSNALQRAEERTASAEQERPSGWAGKIARYITVTRARLDEGLAHRNYRAAREKRDRFDKLQESTARAPAGLKHLTDIARAQSHVSDLLKKIDELRKPGGGDFVDWKDQVSAAAEITVIVRKLARWRKKLFASLLEFLGMLPFFTDAEAFLVTERTQQLFGGVQQKNEDGSLILRLEDVVIPYDLLSEATLANSVTSKSSEDYWADRRATKPPHSTLTATQLTAIAAVDHLRNQAVMYAALFAALVLAAPCLILAGRTLSDPLLVLWVCCAGLLLWLADKARQMTIWTTVVVRIRERQLEQTL